jgi:imidazole glycerol-phosphate synthase subunit HisH
VKARAGSVRAHRAPRATILDYGVGNLHSLVKGLTAAGAQVSVDPEAEAALDTDLLVLPGVGAFTAAAEHLTGTSDMIRGAISEGLPTLGICLGMQMFFEGSDEGPGAGLGVLQGRVTRVRAQRVPHMGWNTVDVGSPDGSYPDTVEGRLARGGPIEAYYANGYVCRPADERIVTAWTTVDDDRFPSIIRRDRIVGVQFHPEKSGLTGLRFLRGIVDAVRASLPPSVRRKRGGTDRSVRQ